MTKVDPVFQSTFQPDITASSAQELLVYPSSTRQHGALTASVRASALQISFSSLKTQLEKADVEYQVGVQILASALEQLSGETVGRTCDIPDRPPEANNGAAAEATQRGRTDQNHPHAKLGTMYKIPRAKWKRRYLIAYWWNERPVLIFRVFKMKTGVHI
uniref:Uncharacterized protein n=1 Tax=Schistocephalus solidus TaxID=70667 RepID=A0A0X3NZY4_SCHSO